MRKFIMRAVVIAVAGFAAIMVAAVSGLAVVGVVAGIATAYGMVEAMGIDF